MKILFNDIIQYSDAPLKLKTPALSDYMYISNSIIIKLDKEYPINSIGIGNSNGENYEIIFNDNNLTSFNFKFIGNGLYVMPKKIYALSITVNTDATHIGRIGAGIGCYLPTSVRKEPALRTTAESRTTLAGQVINGLGGYNFRAISLDVRYKINEQILQEIIDGYKYAGIGYPYFIDLTDEKYKLPFCKLYANERNQRNMVFQSGINKYLYSRKFDFEERF